MKTAVGQRVPFVAPNGAVFLAWSGQAEIDEWVARSVDGGDCAHAERCAAILRGIAQRGFSVGLDAAFGIPPFDQSGEAGWQVDAISVSTRGAISVPSSLGSDGSVMLDYLAAPVFGSHGEVSVGLYLLGFDGPVSGAGLYEHARRLSGVAGVITRLHHGKIPGDPGR